MRSLGERRNIVYDISEEHACDRNWFDPLYRDLENGGYGEFLDFLQNLKLGDWHPRQILKTGETIEQQRMSGDSVSQWAQACINADAIVGTNAKFHFMSLHVDQTITSEILHGILQRTGHTRDE